VLSKLAKEFAVFDNWHCSVPSQTWCNRAFWHAGASGGKVVNYTNECTLKADFKDFESWVDEVWSQPNLFQRMKDAGVDHHVYTQELISITALITGFGEGEDTIVMDRELSTFKQNIQEKKLRPYSFLEPKFTGQHNDMHPSAAKPGFVDGPTKVGSVLLGEHLVWDVYQTIFNSEHYKDNTLLIITFDEHGGCFDHVAPPPHLPVTEENKVWPPHPGVIGEKGFQFDRLGIRVPMIMVSAHIKPNTIINERFDHTSFIKTMSEKWKMPHLTDRDKNANSFAKVFSPEKRTSFPHIAEPPISSRDETEYDNHPLHDLQLSLLRGAYHAALKYKNEIDKSVRVPSIKRVNTDGKMRKYLERIKPILVKVHKTKFKTN
jgi:phospholipase C